MGPHKELNGGSSVRIVQFDKLLSLSSSPKQSNVLEQDRAIALFYLLSCGEGRSGSKHQPSAQNLNQALKPMIERDRQQASRNLPEVHLRTTQCNPSQ